jgi:ArsR family transcriptional regulator, arsenate/arsenite/antimonite-responsive transcriptional repressor
MNLALYHHLLSDPVRLRIVNLLIEGPLCVCHFQGILGEPQVKVSKHLAILRRKGLVDARRSGNWMVYDLCRVGEGWLRGNLKALAGARRAHKFLDGDIGRRKKLLAGLSKRSCKVPEAVCC